MKNEKQLALNDGPKDVSEMGSLLRMAISQDIDTDKLEKLIELKNREEERRCKQDFDFHFAEMQKEFKPVEKSKDGYNFKYAPLELLQKEYGGIISKHGFSYRWREEKLEEGWKRIVLIISGWGYTDDSTYFDSPKLEQNKQQNAIQALAAATTYGKRYTFMSGFGLIVEDEDNDAENLTFEDGIQYSNEVNEIRQCTTMEELKEAFVLVYKNADKDGKAILSREKDKKKKELNNGTGE